MARKDFICDPSPQSAPTKRKRKTDEEKAVKKQKRKETSLLFANEVEIIEQEDVEIIIDRPISPTPSEEEPDDGTLPDSERRYRGAEKRMKKHYIPIKTLSPKLAGMQASISFAIPKADLVTKITDSKTFIIKKACTTLASKLVVVKHISGPGYKTDFSVDDLDIEVKMLEALGDASDDPRTSKAQFFSSLLLADAAKRLCWYSMPLVRGPTLLQWLDALPKKWNAVPPAMVWHVWIQLIEAFEWLHGARKGKKWSMLHGDLFENNVMLDYSRSEPLPDRLTADAKGTELVKYLPNIVILDFGCSKMKPLAPGADVRNPWSQPTWEDLENEGTFIDDYDSKSEDKDEDEDTRGYQDPDEDQAVIANQEVDISKFRSFEREYFSLNNWMDEAYQNDMWSLACILHELAHNGNNMWACSLDETRCHKTPRLPPWERRATIDRARPEDRNIDFGVDDDLFWGVMGMAAAGREATVERVVEMGMEKATMRRDEMLTTEVVQFVKATFDKAVPKGVLPDEQEIERALTEHFMC
jgi:serine/threonine protein kinase